jgi:high affinity Mn2+ porin
MKAIRFLGWLASVALAMAVPASAADRLVLKANPPPVDQWTGFYVGAHMGYAWGRSNWSQAPDLLSDSFSLSKPIDMFQNTGSYFEGIQLGYDYMLPNRVVLGVIVDASFPSFQDANGLSIGGMSFLTSSSLGPQTFSETMLMSGTVRGRVGYAPGNWLFYATGGFAWTRNQSAVTPLGGDSTDSPLVSRFGWAAGAGVEFPIKPHWTGSVEYLYTRYGHTGVFFPNAGQAFVSDFPLQQVRVGLNYRFADATGKAPTKAPAMPDPDLVNFHGQATWSAQTYTRFRAPYDGTNSLPGRPRPREVFDATLYAGLRL